MPWLETNVRDQRIEFVRWLQRPGLTMAEACRLYGISRKTGYKWVARQRDAGSVTALADRSRRPQTSPSRTSAATTQRIRHWREQTGWGGDKLAWCLRGEGLVIAPRTIDRIIHREGWTRTDVSHAPALQRFTRAAPNDLWQMDAKGAYPLPAGGLCHPLSIVDDHSRFAVGLHALPTLQTGGVRAALIRSFERYGVPEAMLMDHGTPWWSTKGPAGLTTLGVFLLQQNIRVIFGAVRHPQTQGKVERFHRTLGDRLRWDGVPSTLSEFAQRFRAFCREYNERRPHAALEMTPPAMHFTPSPRRYTRTPRAWDYGTDVAVRRVSATGQIKWGNHAYFVSEALVGQDVACVACERRILVRYRHMYVRELRPHTGDSVNLLQPVDVHWPA